MTVLPRIVTDTDGVPLTVRRAWPNDDGGLTIEAVEHTSGRLRAGLLHPGGPVRVGRYTEDPVLAGLPGAAAGGELLVHRFRKRAVVRLDGSYLKVLPPRKVEGVAAAHRTARALLAGTGIVVPRVVHSAAGVLPLSVVPGTSLHDLGHAGQGRMRGHDGGVLAAAWDAWSDAWPGFAESGHRLGAPGAVPGAVHRAADEARTLKAWVRRCIAFDVLDVPPATLRAACGRVQKLLLAGNPQEPVLAHRDLHDKQLLLARDPAGRKTLGIIDCDTLVLAEPALDLANLLVHLEFREAQGILDGPGRHRGEQAVFTVAEKLRVPRARLDAYAASTRLRLACVYAFRPQWQDLASGWFRSSFAVAPVPMPVPRSAEEKRVGETGRRSS